MKKGRRMRGSRNKPKGTTTREKKVYDELENLGGEKYEFD